LAALGLAMTAPGQTLGVSVFVDPMLADLGVTRSQLSGAYLVGTLLGALTLPITGRAHDRFGVRALMTVVAAGFGVALAAMAGVAGVLTLAVGFTGIRMLGQGALSLVATTSVALWFDRRRGLALGICMAGGAALMSVAPLGLTQVIDAVGWRATWLIAAAAVWLIVLPIARLGMRDDPASVGQQVDGARPRAGAAQPVTSWTRAEALRAPMFWAVTVAVAASGMIGTGLVFHQISLLGERGLTTVQAAANFLPQTAATITAALTMGWLIDRVRPKLLVLAAMGGLALGMVLAQLTAPGWRAVAFAPRRRHCSRATSAPSTSARSGASSWPSASAPRPWGRSRSRSASRPPVATGPCSTCCSSCPPSRPSSRSSRPFPITRPCGGCAQGARCRGLVGRARLCRSRTRQPTEAFTRCLP
jgi:MFS family permease